jgi:hypothetical protein
MVSTLFRASFARDAGAARFDSVNQVLISLAQLG